jgi:hypothetical protein
VHARTSNTRPVTPAAPDLWLQVVDRNFAFRTYNYSLYPSWLAYPWAHAHLVIRGTRPYSIDRRDRGSLRGEVSTLAALQETAMQYREDLDAAAVDAALLDFARTAPRPALVRLNLNTGAATRKVTGQIHVLGCRLAVVSRGGELATLGGVEFDPALGSEPGGPARTDGLRVRHRILIAPGTQVRFVLPLSLAVAAQSRPRPGQRIEAIEPLPSVFTDSGTFRALWPDGPPPALGRRYRLRPGPAGAGAMPEPVEPQPAAAPALEAGAAP